MMSITKSCHLTFLVFLPQLKMFITTTPVLLSLVISIYSRLNHYKNSFSIMGEKFAEQFFSIFNFSSLFSLISSVSRGFALHVFLQI